MVLCLWWCVMCDAKCSCMQLQERLQLLIVSTFRYINPTNYWSNIWDYLRRLILCETMTIAYYLWFDTCLLLVTCRHCTHSVVVALWISSVLNNIPCVKHGINKVFFRINTIHIFSKMRAIMTLTPHVVQDWVINNTRRIFPCFVPVQANLTMH